ncbi:hypothetical protein STEG23_029515, partial [Scotinomys teguina]
DANTWGNCAHGFAEFCLWFRDKLVSTAVRRNWRDVMCLATFSDGPNTEFYITIKIHMGPDWMWWPTPVISAFGKLRTQCNAEPPAGIQFRDMSLFWLLGRMRQENGKFMAILGNLVTSQRQSTGLVSPSGLRGLCFREKQTQRFIHFQTESCITPDELHRPSSALDPPRMPRKGLERFFPEDAALPGSHKS